MLSGFLATAWLLVALQVQQAPAQATRTVVLENELVLVVEVRAEAGSQIEMHEHPDMMVVVLEPRPGKNLQTNRRFEWAKGETRRGTGFYQPAERAGGPATVINAARAIVIEFKQPAPKPEAARNPSLPLPYKTTGENTHAVQFEATAAPGQTTPEHSHGNHLMVALNDGITEMAEKGGQSIRLEWKKDTVRFGPPVTHTSTNVGKTPFEWILIELK